METIKKQVLIIGHPSCGITSLLRSFDNKAFKLKRKKTIFDDIHKTIQTEDKELKLNIINITILNSTRKVRHKLYSTSDVCILCYSVGNEKHKQFLLSNCYSEIMRIKPEPVLFLVAMKTDLRCNNYSSDCLTTKQGEKLSTALQAKYFFETSTKENKNVKEFFDTLIKYLEDENDYLAK